MLRLWFFRSVDMSFFFFFFFFFFLFFSFLSFFFCDQKGKLFSLCEQTGILTEKKHVY